MEIDFCSYNFVTEPLSEPLEIDEMTEIEKHDPDLCDNDENLITKCETLSAQSKDFTNRAEFIPDRGAIFGARQ